MTTKTSDKIRPIRTEDDYEKALKELEPIFDADTNTPEGERAELLSILIEAYEDKYYPMPSEDDPIDFLKKRMEALKLTTTDLGNIIGYKTRASEILNRKRKMTLPMIRKIHTHLHIPMDILAREYSLAT